MAEEKESELKMFCGTCPDSHCGKQLYFMSHVNSKVECSNCGQNHAPTSLLNVEETTDSKVVVGSLLQSILLSNTATKKGTELVKVRGLSNFHCKLISPLLTKYGMDKKSGKAKLLSELGQPEVFDCSVFGSRAFLIEKEHLGTPGYGRDNTGSLGYLQDTLSMIESANGADCLVPLHSDGDGHCLVHAISRAVIGRELLWHSLRENLKNHLQEDNTKYQALFRDFIDTNEWDEIINEADPDYYPETNEPFGLRNIHVFGLANVLHRPIILLDSLEGMQSSGDYSGIFLPVLIDLEQCKSQGVLNKPLAIAWSSSARNHYVPLVGIRGAPVPIIPRSLLPKAWGIPNEFVSKYIDFDEEGCCAIGGSRSLQDGYVQRLVSAMDEVFLRENEVSPELVADVHQFIFKPSNAICASLQEIIEFTQSAVESERLFRCLSCHAVKEVKDVLPRSWREPGGKWYTRAQGTKTGIITDAVYTFTEAEGVPFMYSARLNMLIPIMEKDRDCDLCKGVIREVTAAGSAQYMNGDRTTTKSETGNKGCNCGFKHFWNGKEYENLPKTIDIVLEWGGKKIEEHVFWFDLESDSSLNSNVYEMATNVVQKHFPGEFGSETLVRKVVDKILLETELKKNEEAPPSLPPAEVQPMDTDVMPNTPAKIVLTGPKHKTLHKEELTMNVEEKLTKARITHHAAYNQKRKSKKEFPEKPSGNAKQGKQETEKTENKAKPNMTSDVPKPLLPVNTKTDQAKPKDIRIRLSGSNGRTATITLDTAATYDNLQNTIVDQLGIPKHRQKIRYGFPPRELKPPEDMSTGLPLTHGDRISVEELPEPCEKEKSMEEPGTESMEVETRDTVTEESSSTSEFEDVDQGKLASDLLSLLQGALNRDKWDVLKHQPEQFARGGMVYEQIVSKLGPLRDDMHCTIVGLPGKTFAYNAKKDRLEICLGQNKHIPVQPLDQETLTQAHKRIGDIDPTWDISRGTNEERESLGAFSGVVKHRNASEGHAAFSGAGHTLGGSEKTGDEKKKIDLPAVNLNVPNEGTTHAPRSEDTNLDKLEDKTRTLIDNGGEMSTTDQTVEINMPAMETDENVAHDMAKNAHEPSSAEHEVSSFEIEKSNIKHEASKNEHEINGEHELTNFEHEMTNVTHVSKTAQNEIENDQNVNHIPEHETTEQ